jgi:hypothetical protein
MLNRPDLETTCNLILAAEVPAIIGGSIPPSFVS